MQNQDREQVYPRASEPYSPLEGILVNVWKEVLCVESIGIHDNFFELGGDSISATRIIAQLNQRGVQLTTTQLLNNQTISQLALASTKERGGNSEGHDSTHPLAESMPGGMNRSGLVLTGVKEQREQTPPAAQIDLDNGTIEDSYPLTPLQRAMHFHLLDSPGGGTYFNQLIFTLQGEMDVAAFKQAYQLLIARHASLRTVFRVDSEGRPVQVVYRSGKFSWEQHDWRRFSEAEQQRKLEELLRAERDQQIDLSKLPLMRFQLIQMGQDLYEFIWDYYLILLDGWSINILLSEVLTIYDALVERESIKLNAPIPFKRYIEWLEQRDPAHAEKYWRQMLSGFSIPTLIEDGQISVESTSDEEGNRFLETSVLVDETMNADLRAFCRQHRLTLNTLVQAAWALYLGRRKGSDDVMFGAVTAGRPVDLSRVESMVGLFINTLPVRVRIPPDVDLTSWMRALQAQQTEARHHEFLSLAQLQKWSDVPRKQNMFDSVIIFQNFPSSISQLDSNRKLKAVDVKWIERNTFPLTLVVEPKSQLNIKVVYERERFHENTIARMLDQLQRLLQQIAAHPDRTPASLSLIAETERRTLIQSFNQNLELC